MARALRPGGHLLLGTHAAGADDAERDVPRTSGYGGVPVRWTTHLYTPEELTAMITAAGLEVVVEQRFPPAPPQPRPQVVVAARRP